VGVGVDWRPHEWLCRWCLIALNCTDRLLRRPHRISAVSCSPSWISCRHSCRRPRSHWLHTVTRTRKHCRPCVSGCCSLC
jgi:hypothetical protein